MMDLYNRNRLYITDDEQEMIRKTRILLGGTGIGSIVAECALRFGFENFVIVDGDKVELSNLNRQNYVICDIGKPKAECLAKRLLQINPTANIRFYNTFINQENVEQLLDGVKVAINALDFKSDIPFIFDELCSDKGIPVLHPYNFGWGGFLTIIRPGGHQLKEVAKSYKGFELKMAKFAALNLSLCGTPNNWLDDVIKAYSNEPEELPPPQLSVASWITAGYCVNAIFDIITEREVKSFPEFYFSSLRCNRT